MTVRASDRSFNDVTQGPGQDPGPYATKGGGMIYVGLVVIFLILLGALMMMRRGRRSV